MPRLLVTLDGSQSTDDHKITDYLWVRDPKSLAAGVSDKKKIFVPYEGNQGPDQTVHLQSDQNLGCPLTESMISDHR